MDNYFREKVWSFSLPYYNGKDVMHGIKHIERVLKEADNLASKYPQANRDIVFTGCCFQEIVRSFLNEINMHEEKTEKCIRAAFES